MFDPTDDKAWVERYERITRKWAALSKRARKWCNGYDHKMGPLHRHSAYDRVEHTRITRCKRCRFQVWVKLDGTLQGLPSYRECPVARDIRLHQERLTSNATVAK